MTSASFTQVAFRGRNDDGSESGASWITTQNSNWTQLVGTNFRIRFLIDETASRSWSNKTWNLYYSKNGGTYALVAAAGTPVIIVMSSYYSDGEDCVSRLTGGSGSFLTDNNGMRESTGGATNSGAAGNYFELEYNLWIDSTGNNNGDYFDFRIYDSSSPITTYSNTPRVTASKPILLSKASITATGRQIYPDNGIRKLNTAVLTATGRKICLPLGIVLDIDHEDGTEDEWTGEIDGHNDLSVSTSAACAGTQYGLEGLVSDGTYFSKYADVTSARATGFVQVRFYLDLTDMVVATGEEFSIVSLARNDYVEIARVYIYRESSDYTIYAGLINDYSGLIVTDNYTFSKTSELCVEIRVTRAVTASSADGSISLWLDGEYKETVGNNDNYDRFTDFLRMQAGYVYGTLTYPASAGDIYLDEFVVRDDGQYIGPKTTGINISLAKAALTATGRPITLSLGAVSVSLSKASVAATGRTITISAPPPATTVNLQRGIVTANGRPVTVIPGAKTVSVNQAIATATGRTTTVVKGAATVTLSRGIATATGGAIKINYAVNLAKATATATGRPVSVVPGAKTVSVNTGILTATGRQINVLRPITLLAAQATATGRPITLSLGAVTKSLNTAIATAQGRVITVVPGAKTVTLTTATATALGRAITVSAPPPGAINIQLSTAQATATGRAIKINYAVNLARGQAAATGQVIKINYAVNLTRAQATATGRVITVVKGTATVSLSRGIATATGRVITVSAPPPSPITVSLYTAQAAATGRAITVLKGTATIQLDEAQAVAVGRGAVIVKGAVTKALARGILTATGRTITVINVVGISVSLDTAQATASGRALTVLPGAKSVALNTGSLSATGRPITFSMGAVAIVLACGALAASGRAIRVDSPGPITHAPYLTLLERDRELTVEIRDRELTLFLRSIYLSLEETR